MSTTDDRDTDAECNTPDTREELTTAEFFSWLELACWTMVALAPFLYWVNGPAVSTDQFVVRSGLVTLAVVGGVTIRVTKWLRRK